ADQKTRASQLTADLRKQAQDLRSELTEAANALDDEKASREDMGDMLVEMGMRLKDQIGLGDLLGQMDLAEALQDDSGEPEEQEEEPAE
ncbi:hypothetical protein ACFLWA_08495, partial [Chloroflexota bacterium]